MRSHTVVCAKSEFRESLFKGLRIPGADELFAVRFFWLYFMRYANVMTGVF